MCFFLCCYFTKIPFFWKRTKITKQSILYCTNEQKKTCPKWQCGTLLRCDWLLTTPYWYWLQYCVYSMSRMRSNKRWQSLSRTWLARFNCWWKISTTSCTGFDSNWKQYQPVRSARSLATAKTIDVLAAARLHATTWLASAKVTDLHGNTMYSTLAVATHVVTHS